MTKINGAKDGERRASSSGRAARPTLPSMAQLHSNVKITRRIPFVLAACSLGLSGCVLWHSTTLSSNDDTARLTLAVNAAGFLLVGPCSTPYVGKITEAEAVIKLNGVKDRYSENDFEIVDSGRTTWRGGEEMNGLISFDRKSRMVDIKVYIKGRPFRLNGLH